MNTSFRPGYEFEVKVYLYFISLKFAKRFSMAVPGHKTRIQTLLKRLLLFIFFFLFSALLYTF